MRVAYHRTSVFEHPRARERSRSKFPRDDHANCNGTRSLARRSARSLVRVSKRPRDFRKKRKKTRETKNREQSPGEQRRSLVGSFVFYARGVTWRAIKKKSILARRDSLNFAARASKKCLPRIGTEETSNQYQSRRNAQLDTESNNEVSDRSSSQKRVPAVAVHGGIVAYNSMKYRHAVYLN